MNAAPAGSASVSAALAQIAGVKKGHCARLHAGGQAFTLGGPSRIRREGRATECGAIRMTCRLAKMCGAFVPQRLQARSLERRANIGSTNGATCSQAARQPGTAPGAMVIGLVVQGAFIGQATRAPGSIWPG